MCWNRFDDPRLTRCLHKLAKQYPDWKENDYFEHFLQIINDDSQSDAPKQIAYLWFIFHLDPVIKQVIRRSSRKLCSYEGGEDAYFEIITDLLTNKNGLRAILNKYDPQHTSQSGLRGYFSRVIERRIKEKLKLRSPWHLLGKSSQENFKQALSRSGLLSGQIHPYLLAWECFVGVYKENHIYNPQRNRNSGWPIPEEADFITAAQDYNDRRFQPDVHPSLSSGSDLTPQNLEKWMNEAIEALYKYQQIQEVSGDNNGHEYSQGSYYPSANPWQWLEDQEKQLNPGLLGKDDEEELSFAEQVDQVFQEELRKIKNQEEKFRSRIKKQFRKGLMPICYKHPLYLLRQSQFAAKVGVNQGTVSRYIDGHYTQLLIKQVEALISQKLKVEEEVWAINCIDVFLSQGLINTSENNFINQAITNGLQQLDVEAQTIVKLRFSQGMNIEAIAAQLRVKTEQVELQIQGAKKELASYLWEKIQGEKDKIVDSWLNSHYKQIINLVLQQFLAEIEQESREILKLRYCQRLKEGQIQAHYPHLNVSQTIAQVKQKLQNNLLHWTHSQFSISLHGKDEKNSARVIDTWLKNLVYYPGLAS